MNIALLLFATTLYLGQGTKPFKVGTQLPKECSAGESFFKKGADPSESLFVCSVTDAWTVAEEYGYLENGRCSVCKAKGLKSTVKMDGVSSCTTLWCGSADPDFDEDGNPIPSKSCNTCTTYGKCSRGHSLTEKWPSQ